MLIAQIYYFFCNFAKMYNEEQKYSNIWKKMK